MAKTKGLYKRGNIWWIRYTGPDGKKRFESNMLAGGKAPATVNRHVACLKHMITKAVEWEMAPEQTLHRLRMVKQIPEHNRRLRYLSVEECQALVNACLPHLKPIVITALNT